MKLLNNSHISSFVNKSTDFTNTNINLLVNKNINISVSPISKKRRYWKLINQSNKKNTQLLSEKVNKLIEQLNKEIAEIGDDMDIVKDLGADSLDIVEMVMNIEEEFGITIDDEKAVNVKTVKDIVSLLENK